MSTLKSAGDAAIHTNAIVRKALTGALNRRLGAHVSVDDNDVDAFMARLMDAGVDPYELDELFVEADPDLIDKEDENY